MAGVATGAGFDRGGILTLAAGHFVVDMLVGALPALLPLFVREYELSDLAASMVLGASLLASSATQPAFGLVADRRAAHPLLWGGVALAAVAVAAAGAAPSYPVLLALIVVSGLGIAAYHPEAARSANRLSAGRPATGLAWFMVGGNAGFAVGPLLAALAIPFLGLATTVVFLAPAALVVLLLALRRHRLSPPVAHASRTAHPAPTHVPGLALLLAVTTLRTWTQFTLLALVPLLLVRERGLSDTAAGLTVFAFSAGGAIGTIGGAAIAERVGGRRMLIATMPLAAPFAAGAALLPTALVPVTMTLAGLILMASFSVTVAMGQEYLPSRLALAAGLMIGFGAIGSAPPGLALFGALADALGREPAILLVSALPLAGGALSLLLPPPRRPQH
ncbi:MAG TPA: MFS transporter, partial [Miltoncostaeaceae bacterium]|nr:MFS transporter [Miltoncostaeaceae bacterium]